MTAPVQKGFGEIVIAHMAVAPIQGETVLLMRKTDFHSDLAERSKRVITK